MSFYRLHVDGKTTGHRVKGTSPTRALVKLCEDADLLLVSQSGRYGKALSDDGDELSVMALTEPWGRVDSPDARTTRLLDGKELR